MADDQPEQPAIKPKKKRRRTRRRFVVLLLFLAVLIGLPFAAQFKKHGVSSHLPDSVTASYDRYKVAAERIWRRSYVRHVHDTLPGTPDLENLSSRLKTAGHSLGDPMLIRIFKQEFELEIWLRKDDGRFKKFTTYPICRFSGRLGPKLKQGDRQAPEGFYTVSKGLLNPNSRWHRSFNLGFPNTFDRAHGRTGSFLMVHGGCSSIGCYAMTNDVIDEVWSLITSALNNGQRRVQVQAYPFRMTDENLAARANNRWAGFWRDLKFGHDLFTTTRVPPRAHVCQKRYIFAQGNAASKSAAPIVKSCANAPKLAENEHRPD